MEKTNLNEENKEQELAYLEDLSGRRKFIKLGEKVYFVDQNGKKEEVSEQDVLSAIDKHSYIPSQ